jgi:hypothetical protein
VLILKRRDAMAGITSAIEIRRGSLRGEIEDNFQFARSGASIGHFILGQSHRLYRFWRNREDLAIVANVSLCCFLIP